MGRGMTMNKKFVTKMITAKKLEYEALRELIPEKVNRKIDDMSNRIIDEAKECFIELYLSGNNKDKQDDNNPNSNIKKVTIG